MKTRILAVSFLFLGLGAGCGPYRTTYMVPSDPVYTVGYYGYRPFGDARYYPTWDKVYWRNYPRFYRYDLGFYPPRRG